MEQETIDEIEEAPEDGVYVHGFYLDGARYNREDGVIDDQIPVSFIVTMSVCVERAL